MEYKIWTQGGQVVTPKEWEALTPYQQGVECRKAFVEIERLQAELAEARELITDECAAHDDDCLCDVCEYWFKHKE